MTKTGISVIMPTYNQSSYINRAIRSLFEQHFKDWEIIIINDGSTDDTDIVINKIINNDSRINYLKNTENKGLGYCLNTGIGAAKYDLIAYLPSDDIYYADHLAILLDTINRNADAVLAFSGLKFGYQDNSFYSSGHYSIGKIPNLWFQLVQILHKKNNVRWVERDELVTDDLDRMFWHKLQPLGTFVNASRITAEWTSHPHQRSKIINELRGGGIYYYKQYYKVTKRLQFQSSHGNLINEFTEYKAVEVNKISNCDKPLKILLVGELAYNPQRICAFEKQGHKLYGLWMNKPHFYNTIGPLPFGNVVDIPFDNWESNVKELKPDIIYALLNEPAVPLAHEVLVKNPGIPFVWHFKESPFFCRQNGLWDKLVDLYQKSDGQIYINEVTQKWFEQFLINPNPATYILDGDLPAMAYF
ncbi:MAG: glycosyl transferase family 2 [Mucilaginibacter sp.]|nr:glycosyl transferase family 2 [Mucilaginibacter sp.]